MKWDILEVLVEVTRIMGTTPVLEEEEQEGWVKILRLLLEVKEVQVNRILFWEAQFFTTLREEVELPVKLDRQQEPEELRVFQLTVGLALEVAKMALVLGVSRFL